MKFFKLRILFVFTVVFSLNTLAQFPQVQLGISLGDGPAGRDEIMHLVQDNSGNIYTVGTIRGAIDVDPGPNVKLLAPASSSEDVWVGKYSNTGDLLWAFNFGNTSGETVNAIQVDNNGNAYIIGTFVNTVDFDPSNSVFNLTTFSASNSDGFVAKFDSNGNFIWAKQFGGPSVDNGQDLIISNDGHFYITGNFSQTADLDMGPEEALFTSSGFNDAFVAKYDLDGNYVWAFSYQGSSVPCNGESLAFAANGDLIVSGIFQQTIDLDPSAEIFNVSSAGNYDVFLAKYSPDAEFIWGFKVGSNQVDEIEEIKVAPSGDILLVGSFSVTVDFDPSAEVFTSTSLGQRDIFIASYGTDGNFNWVKPYGSSSNDEGRTVGIDNNGNVYFSGYFTNTVDFNPGSGESEYTAVGGDLMLVSLTAEGIHRWSFALGGTGFDSGNTIFCNNTEVIVGGEYANTIDFDPGSGVSQGSGDLQNGFFSSYNLSDGNFIRHTSFTDRQGGNDRGEFVVTDSNNNIYVGGQFAGEVDFERNGNGFIGSFGGEDAFLAKYSNSGIHAWTVNIGGALNDRSNSAVVDASGNVYLTGIFSNTVDLNPNGSPAEVTSAGNIDLFLAKYNSNGILQWGFSIGGSSSDEAYEVKLDNNGNVVLVGYFRNDVLFDPLGSSATSLNSNLWDAFVAKYNPSNGHLIWAKSFAGTSGEYARTLVVNAQNEIFVGGNFNGSIDFEPGSGNPVIQSVNGMDAFLAKLTAEGNLIWGFNIGGLNDEFIYSLALDNEGNVYPAGSFTGTIIFDPIANPDTITSAGLTDLFYAKFDANGTLDWYTAFGGISADFVNEIRCFNESIYLTGGFRENVDFDPSENQTILSSPGALRTFVAQYSTERDFESVFLLDSPGGSIGNGLEVNSQGLYLTGYYIGSMDIQPGLQTSFLNANGGDDLFLIRFGEGEPCEPTTASLDAEGCAPVIVNGINYSSNGTFVQTLINSLGCDSILTVNITILPASQQTLIEESCNAFTLNGTSYSESGIFTQTLTNAAGCDSLLTLNLTILESSTETINQIACNSFSLNDETYTSSGVYTQTLLNAAGCDSIITLNLTINSSSTEIVQLGSCSPLVLNGETYTQSGIYNQILTNANGCDSLITVEFTLFEPTSEFISIETCISYLLNGMEYTESGVYEQNLTNINGCDSTLTLNLTIGDIASEEITVFSCEPFTINGETFNESGVYEQNLISINECDSILTVNLTIGQNSSSELQISSCATYVLNGEIYSESGIYTQTILNQLGCDSTITLNLTIEVIDLVVSQIDNILMAEQNDVSYQWFNCDTQIAIPEEDNQSFEVLQSGNYAVILTKNDCVDTTECINVIVTKNTLELNDNTLSIFPNPGFGEYTLLDVNRTLAYPLNIEIYSLQGAIIQSNPMYNSIHRLNLDAASGLYFVNVIDQKGKQIRFKLIHK